MTIEWARQGRQFDVEALPDWLAPVAEVAAHARAEDLTRFVPPHGEGRHSAVLMLFGPERDLLIIQRASTMRAHPGQPALPGGAVDDDDESAVQAALREANEETGLDPSGVDAFAQLPDLWVPVTGFVVTPVLGWWREPSPVWARDPAEVSSVHRITIEEFIDPAHRCRVVHPSGHVGPGFEVRGLLVWGFTAGLISGLLDRVGWSEPWDDSRVVPLDEQEPVP
jgi:8-oxo-dGTP pyrophosphatase MutT (NUDIX family)